MKAQIWHRAMLGASVAAGALLGVAVVAVLARWWPGARVLGAAAVLMLAATAGAGIYRDRQVRRGG